MTVKMATAHIPDFTWGEQPRSKVNWTDTSIAVYKLAFTPSPPPTITSKDQLRLETDKITAEISKAYAAIETKKGSKRPKGDEELAQTYRRIQKKEGKPNKFNAHNTKERQG